MNILVCIDFSDSTEKVVSNSEKLAKGVSAKLWILHVAEPEPDFVGYDPGPQYIRDSLAEQFHQEHRLAQEIAKKMREKGLEATALLIQGSTAEVILETAEKIEADIIVIGTHGKGAVYHLLVGSVSEAVIHKAECPIFVVPTRERS